MKYILALFLLLPLSTPGRPPNLLRILAGNPAHQAEESRLAAALDARMSEQSDPGRPVDTPAALDAARKGTHLYGPGKKVPPGI